MVPSGDTARPWVSGGAAPGCSGTSIVNSMGGSAATGRDAVPRGERAMTKPPIVSAATAPAPAIHRPQRRRGGGGASATSSMGPSSRKRSANARAVGSRAAGSHATASRTSAAIGGGSRERSACQSSPSRASAVARSGGS